MNRFVPLLVLLCCACEEPHVSIQQKYEPGKVLNLVYVPPGHGETSGTSFSTSGDLEFHSGNVHIPARYGMVFQCQHGSFAVDGHEETWKSLQVGACVTIEYNDVHTSYDDGRQYDALQFVNAIKVPCQEL